MQILHPCCGGLDVHAKNVVACLMKNGRKQIRTFSTMTDDLLALLDWLTSEGCTHVAIESTGVYWKPIFNILEGSMEVLLVNARGVKAVPGRKTDVRDCEWLADLLRHGLLRASFIPPAHIRGLRELTRHRQSLVRELAAVANRVQKLIESADIKLAQVASDALGSSGRAMLRALAAGEEDVTKMAELAKGRMKAKKPQLRLALKGKLTAPQRWVLEELLDHYEELEVRIAKANERIDVEVAQCQHHEVEEAVKLLQTIPGIGQSVAQTVVAEIGARMGQFPSDAHLSSWAGMCPGNNESAGKRRSGKTTKGSPYLRAALVQAGWAASCTKQTYLSSQYHRLYKRSGRKKALVAVGHSLLVIIYHVLKNKAGYEELGGNYFDTLQVDRQRKRLIEKLKSLGVTVTVEAISEAA
jgi:transposase